MKVCFTFAASAATLHFFPKIAVFLGFTGTFEFVLLLVYTLAAIVVGLAIGWFLRS